jgi:transcriptional regulator with XRE-family HTH domain
MSKMERVFDPAAIAAEENLVIDFQFLIEELMTKHGMTRSMLAARAGITPARLSQLMGSEANPTAKSLARLFHALGEEVTPVRKADLAFRTQAKHYAGLEEQLGKDLNRRSAKVDSRSLLRVLNSNVVVLDATNRSSLVAA